MPTRKAVSRWIVTGLALGVAIVFVAGYTDDIPLAELTRKYATPGSRFVDVLGMRVHYRDEGDGPPLVLLHGTSSSLQTWDAWVDILRYDFRVVRLDLPGFGLTGPDPMRDYSIDRYIEFVDAFANAAGLGAFSVAGNSLGGQIAWHYALVYPERVQRLVLIDAAGHPERAAMNESLAFRLARIPILNRFVTVLTPRSLIEKSVLEVYGEDSKVTPELVDRYFDLVRRPGNRQAFVDRVRNIDRDPVRDPRGVVQPTL
ncbi:MAG: alpha/beta hydrolase, partial [Gammaproteobacteria bacterium]|nr:alpha/beta hydrolase [Gammaproteobacteria bacterium]